MIQNRTTLHRLISHLKIVAFDFDGVFTDNSVYLFEDGREAVRCSRSAGPGLRKLESLGLVPLVISTETNPVVSRRCEKLAIRCIQACADKAAAVESLAAEFNIQLDQIAFVGNDVNDLPALTRVGLPIVVADAHPDVVHTAIFQTTKPGGHGAVREVCDLIWEQKRNKID